MDLSKMSEDAVDRESAERELDDRIACTNGAALDKMLEITTKHVKMVAESLPYESRSRFVTRFLEVYQETLQQNVTVNGAPWQPSAPLACPALAEQQLQESEDGSRSRLADAVEGVAARRKTVPKDCARILEMELKHSRQNLKMLEVEHPMPSSPPLRPSTDTFCHQELVEVLEDLTREQTNIYTMDQELTQLESDYIETRRILAQSWNDTGYQTS